MKIAEEVILINCGGFAESVDWASIKSTLRNSIAQIEWPENSGRFSIYPVEHANGVTPIKKDFIKRLIHHGWTKEHKIQHLDLGKFDAAYLTDNKPVVAEWETGNIASSHRSLNKMTFSLSEGTIAAGVLIVPSKALYRFLTDRVGNIYELERYFKYWSNYKCAAGLLEIIAVEYDETSLDAPKIPKGTDGRAIR